MSPSHESPGRSPRKPESVSVSGVPGHGHEEAVEAAVDALYLPVPVPVSFSGVSPTLSEAEHAARFVVDAYLAALRSAGLLASPHVQEESPQSKWECPVCGLTMPADDGSVDAHCAGSLFGGTAHGRTPMVRSGGTDGS